jgi:hypothetical protein
VTDPGREVLWAPHPGPQTAFLASEGYEVLYGGQAGGGKSDALLFGSLRGVEHPKYRALILRRTFPELRELIDRSLETFGGIGGKWSAAERRWHYPSGATVEFGYCENYSDVMQYQGQQFTSIAFDEIGQLPEERVWTYLMSRNRAAAEGLVPIMRASANPGGPGHQWLKKRFVDVCPVDGSTITVGRHTRAFIKASLKDNPTLTSHDPEYEDRLKLLPELEYRWLGLGDWGAGAGLALHMDRERHLIQPFEIPPHWTMFGALDWGYNHPFAWGIFACSEDGVVYLVNTATGRHSQPPEIVSRAESAAGAYWDRVRYSVAGHDVWADVRARSEHIPTLAEQFVALKAPMVKANISRISGVQNMRRYLTGGNEKEKPRFQIFDTPTNRQVYECLESRVSDPDNIEDVLKQDADAQGRNGDDFYDMVRYGLASRPFAAPLPRSEQIKEDNRAPLWDFEKKRLARVTPDEALKEAMGFQNPRLGVGRHRVPRSRVGRRGR